MMMVVVVVRGGLRMNWRLLRRMGRQAWSMGLGQLLVSEDVRTRLQVQHWIHLGHHLVLLLHLLLLRLVSLVSCSLMGLEHNRLGWGRSGACRSLRGWMGHPDDYPDHYPSDPCLKTHHHGHSLLFLHQQQD